MQMKHDSLGAWVDRYRHAKHLSISQVCAAAQISRATYHRFVNGQADLTLHSVMTLLSMLSLELDELSDALQAQLLPLDAALQLVAQAQSDTTVDRQALVAWCQQQYWQSQNPGFAQLVSVLAYFDQRANGERRRAQATATALAQTLLTSREWVSFDLRVMALIATDLPWSLLQKSCWQRLTTCSVATTNPEAMAGIGQAYLKAALHQATTSAVHEACGWLHHLPLTANRLANRALVHFADLVDAVVVAGADPKVMTNFKTHYHQLFGSADWPHYAAMWQQVLTTTFRQNVLVKPNQPKTPLTAVPELATVLRRIRRQRHLSVSALCQVAGISRSTWQRVLQAPETARFSTVMGICDSLRLNLSDLMALWQPAQSQAHEWFAALAALPPQPATIHAAVAQWQATYQRQWAKCAPTSVALLQAAGAIVVAEVCQNRAQLELAVQQTWQQLNWLGEWTRFDYQLLVPIIEYLDYPQVRLAFNRYLDLRKHGASPLAAPIVDALSCELVLCAWQSADPQAIQASLAAIEVLATRHHGENFVIGEHFAQLVCQKQAQQDALATKHYQQVRAALRYFAPRAQDQALIGMLDWLWHSL